MKRNNSSCGEENIRTLSFSAVERYPLEEQTQCMESRMQTFFSFQMTRRRGTSRWFFCPFLVRGRVLILSFSFLSQDCTLISSSLLPDLRVASFLSFPLFAPHFSVLLLLWPHSLFSHLSQRDSHSPSKRCNKVEKISSGRLWPVLQKVWSNALTLDFRTSPALSVH